MKQGRRVPWAYCWEDTHYLSVASKSVTWQRHYKTETSCMDTTVQWTKSRRDSFHSLSRASSRETTTTALGTRGTKVTFHVWTEFFLRLKCTSVRCIIIKVSFMHASCERAYDTRYVMWSDRKWQCTAGPTQMVLLLLSCFPLAAVHVRCRKQASFTWGKDNQLNRHVSQIFTEHNLCCICNRQLMHF